MFEIFADISAYVTEGSNMSKFQRGSKYIYTTFIPFFIAQLHAGVPSDRAHGPGDPRGSARNAQLGV